MRTFVIVEPEEACQGAFELIEPGEVAIAEGHAPVLMKDGSLETFREPIGPRVLGFGPGVPDAEFVARSVELPSVLAAAIGEDPLERPPSLLIEGYQDLAEGGSGPSL